MMRADDETTDCVEQQPWTAWITRHSGPWFPLVWAPLLLAAPLAGSLVDRQLARTGALLVVGLVYAVTVRLPWGPVDRGRGPAELALLLLGALCTAYLVIWRVDRQFLFPLLAIAVATAVRPRWALGLIGSLAVSGAIAAGVEDRSVATALALAFATYFAGAATFLVHHLVGVVGELTRTRQRLARLAVDEERSRFSRDLHDLLGHTLSVMVVKAQAVRRLAERDPSAAAAHASDVETIGRQALTEVRAAVTGYRTVRLAQELRNAGTALTAANVRVDITGPDGDLPDEIDSLFGWVVREATTNVLRHAAAGRCRITVTSGAATADVEIIDDGRGDTGQDRSRQDGSGLHGLRERVEDLGGVLTATATTSGFRLAVSVPTPTAAGRR
ncbi:sensor histidine kinase [Micromonospora sp. CPCC 206061]|uniref:sensor histidine kinase n=1 Tax=Micromonospora sp. CPCC 206061 TaxID=3122410 RepID=UPI002FEE6DAE